jgi:hypothetical protein
MSASGAAPNFERFAILKLHEHQPLPQGYDVIAHGGGAYVWSHLQGTKAQHLVASIAALRLLRHPCVAASRR